MQNKLKKKSKAADTSYEPDEPTLGEVDSISAVQKSQFVFEVLEEPLQVRVSRYYSSI